MAAVYLDKRCPKIQVTVSSDVCNTYQVKGGVKVYCKCCIRLLYRVRQVLVKIDNKPQYRFSQTENEVKIWQQLDKQDRIYFAPILAYDLENRWIVQPFFTWRRGRRSYADSDIADDLFNKYGLIDHDHQNGNWAITSDGRLIIYDYGL